MLDSSDGQDLHLFIWEFLDKRRQVINQLKKFEELSVYAIMYNHTYWD